MHGPPWNPEKSHPCLCNRGMKLAWSCRKAFVGEQSLRKQFKARQAIQTAKTRIEGTVLANLAGRHLKFQGPMPRVIMGFPKLGVPC